MFRWTWTVFGILLFCDIIHHTVSEVTVCSEYLVSGLYGVDDAALTASSSYTNRHGPENGRLHFEGNYGQQGGVASSWSASRANNQQYIQVQFPREIEVDTIMIQGRGDTGYNQRVETYYVLHSIDGNTWSTVMSNNQNPKLFTGNSDSNTVVKSSLVPSITAVYIRINPRSWNSHVSLRFDVSGCYEVENKTGRSTFSRVPLLPSSNLDVVFESQSQSLPNCRKMCHTGETCFSFTFDTNQKICRGYKSSTTAQYASFSTSTNYFINKGMFVSLGFRSFSDGFTLYKVNEVSLNQTTAADVCNQQFSRLIQIKTEPEMSSLQSVIAGNTILMKDHNQLFVSGMYLSSQWKYSNEAEIIDSDLWSPDNPDPSQGHCVMLTQTGLASVNCTESLYSICESIFYS